MFPFTTSVNAFANKVIGGIKDARIILVEKSLRKNKKEKYKAFKDMAFYLGPPATSFTLATGSDDERGEEIDRQADMYIDKYTGGGFFPETKVREMKNISLGLDVLQGDLQGCGPLGIALNYTINTGLGQKFNIPFTDTKFTNQ